jgi:hypothetical protein
MSHLKILGARSVHTEERQTLGCTVQNLVAIAICRPGFVPLFYGNR